MSSKQPMIFSLMYLNLVKLLIGHRNINDALSAAFSRLLTIDQNETTLQGMYRTMGSILKIMLLILFYMVDMMFLMVLLIVDFFADRVRGCYRS